MTRPSASWPRSSASCWLSPPMACWIWTRPPTRSTSRRDVCTTSRTCWRACASSRRNQRTTSSGCKCCVCVECHPHHVDHYSSCVLRATGVRLYRQNQGRRVPSALCRLWAERWSPCETRRDDWTSSFRPALTACSRWLRRCTTRNILHCL